MKRRWRREKAIGESESEELSVSLCLCVVVVKLLLLNKLCMKHIKEYNNKKVKLGFGVVVTGHSRC